MCVSDWRAGRFMRSAFRAATVVAGTPVVIAGNRQRVGIRLSLTSAAAAAADNADITVGGAVVGVLSAFTFAAIFSLDTDGDLPTKSYSISTGAAGPVIIGIAETFMTEEFLNAGTEQWKAMLLGGPR